MLNDALVGGLGSVSVAEVWTNNRKETKRMLVKDGAFQTRVPPKGIVALRLQGAVANTRLQHKVVDRSMPPLSAHSRIVSQSEPSAFGIVCGLVLRWGAGMTELYAYSQANSTMFGHLVSTDATATSHTVFDSVALRVSIDGGTERVIVGTMFPFDFSVPLPDDCKAVSFGFFGVSSDGTTLRTKQFELHVTEPSKLKTDDEAHTSGGTCTGYLVSGAGSTSVNGCYVQRGEFDQRPLFVLDSGHKLYYYSSPPHANSWRLGLAGHNATYVSATASPAFPMWVPPDSTGGCGTWTPVGPGVAPCPAVERSNLPPAPPPPPPPPPFKPPTPVPAMRHAAWFWY